MEYLQASERKENEFEHERALFGHLIDAGSATWLFNGVVRRDAFGRGILALTN
jgi:hypothetical protein